MRALLGLLLVVGLLAGLAVMFLGAYGWFANNRDLNWTGRIWWWLVVLGICVFNTNWYLGEGYWKLAALFSLCALGCLGRLCVLLARRYEVRT